MKPSGFEMPRWGWYALAVLLGVALRFLRLGEIPLAETEAQWALRALALAGGEAGQVGAQPAYVLVTSFLFFLFQATDFTARLAPALWGSFLPLAPFLFRDKLGERPAILLAFLLAVEPGFLAFSRMAGSPIFAVSALVFAWGFWRNAKPRLAGSLLGLALLGGVSLWAGALGLALTYLLSRRLLPASADAPSLGAEGKQAFFFAAGVYLTVGSLFLRVPAGLGAGFDSLAEYLRGWLDFTDVPAWRLLLALLVYQLPALLLGAAALVRGILQQEELPRRLGIWFGVALLLALANPYRQVMDLAWALLPLWALAALELNLHLRPIREGVWETLGTVVFTLALLAFAGLNFASVAFLQFDYTINPLPLFPDFQVSEMQLRLTLLAGTLVILALAILMVAYTWSGEVAMQGSLWGGLGGLGVYLLAVAISSAGLRAQPTAELWLPGYGIAQARTLLAQVQEISQWQTGTDREVEITISTIDSAALRWTLRDFPLRLSAEADLGSAPALILSPDLLEGETLEDAYRGMRFSWRAQPAWNSSLPAEWLPWLITHQMPQPKESILLWVRNDIFLDSHNKTP